MASNSKEIVLDMTPLFRLFTDGTIDRNPLEIHPASDDPNDAVRSKDVVIDPETGVSVRIFMPGRQLSPPQRLPLVVYAHGGGFCFGSATNSIYHDFVANLVEKANVIAVSIDYRLAPENPLPIPFEDSWAAFQWIAAHAAGQGPNTWLNDHVDFGRVFIGGDSVGATIASDVAIRAGVEQPIGVEIVGVFLAHAFFVGGKEENKFYKFLCPTSSGRDDDPRLNPAVDGRIGRMPGRRVLFLMAENDFLRDGSWAYYEGLKKSEWNGEVEIMETEGEGHCFYIFNLSCDKATAVMDRLVGFINAA